MAMETTVVQHLAGYAGLVAVSIGCCYLDFRFMNGQGKLASPMVAALCASAYMLFQGPEYFAAAVMGAMTMFVSVKAIVNKYN